MSIKEPNYQKIKIKIFDAYISHISLLKKFRDQTFIDNLIFFVLFLDFLVH